MISTLIPILISKRQTVPQRTGRGRTKQARAVRVRKHLHEGTLVGEKYTVGAKLCGEFAARYQGKLHVGSGIVILSLAVRSLTSMVADWPPCGANNSNMRETVDGEVARGIRTSLYFVHRELDVQFSPSLSSSSSSRRHDWERYSCLITSVL